MKPLWKQMFDAVEQASAPRMADATSSNAFAEFAKVSSKISKDVNRQAEAATRQWLHLWNLPAAGDLTYLKRQIGSLENEVRSLRRENERFQQELLERTGSLAELDANADIDSDGDEGPGLEIAS